MQHHTIQELLDIENHRGQELVGLQKDIIQLDQVLDSSEAKKITIL